MSDKFDPYNFDYKAYMLETYNLTEMPTKYYRGEYRCDDVFLNAQDAVWVERKGKELGDYRVSSFVYRLFSYAEDNDTTYYLLEKDRPFIAMEYSFTRITTPIKGIENKHIWNFKGDKGLARNFFDDYILKLEPVIISDAAQTEKGFNFWKYLFEEHVKHKKTHKMYVIDINNENVGAPIEDEKQMESFYADTNTGKYRFVLEKNNRQKIIMVTINVKNTAGISLPKQATSLSAGYDIITISDPKIVGEKLDDKFFLPDEPKVEWWKHISYIEYETGLFISPSDKIIHTLIYPRSSISSKTNLVLANSVGLLDADYRGHLLCRFRYIWQPYDLAWLNVKDHSDANAPYVSMTLGQINPEKIYKKGDAIAQLVFSPTTNVNFQFVDELDQTTRGEGGFGSTDKSQSQPSTMPQDPNKPGGHIIELYNKAGGIPIKKRYIDQVRERDNPISSRPPSGQPIPQKSGIRERI